MRQNYFIVFTLAFLFVISSCKVQQKKDVVAVPVLINDIDSLSYCLGTSISKSIVSQKFDSINVDILSNAMKDVMANKELLIDESEQIQYIRNYMQKQEEKIIAENSAEGKAFLEQNAKKEGVVTLESGLQYKVLEKGDGEIPSGEDKVKVHYHGTLIDGTVFDSSVERGEPIEFNVQGVIKGWTEALQLMPVGSKWKLFIPSELGYGERGAGEQIGPYAVLVFEVELLSIVK